MPVARFVFQALAAMLFQACSAGDANQPPAADAPLQQIALPSQLCELVPQPEAEKIMGRALVPQRNDEWACHYQDARGTMGTGLQLNLNSFDVSDQCRLISESAPVTGIGTQACMATGFYTTLVFGSGGRTFVVMAPAQEKPSELATAVARVMLARLDAGQ